MFLCMTLNEANITPTRVSMCVYLCVFLCACVSIFMRICVCMYACINMYMCACMHTHEDHPYHTCIQFTTKQTKNYYL
jgi:hypothetical protein